VQTDGRECLLSFSAESFVFRFALQKYKEQDIQKFNFAFGFVWLLTLREECRLRVFENGVLRKIFGLKRDELTGKCSKLHNEELNDLCCLPKAIWVIKSRIIK
jgi:hypothetical protein